MDVVALHFFIENEDRHVHNGAQINEIDIVWWSQVCISGEDNKDVV